MRFIRDMPIKQKLAVLMMAIGAVTAMMSGGSLIVFECYRFRTEAIRDVSEQAEIMGAASAAALAFGDTQAATEILTICRGNADVLNACLMTPDGKLFAEYKRHLANQTPAWQASGSGLKTTTSSSSSPSNSATTSSGRSRCAPRYSNNAASCCRESA